MLDEINAVKTQVNTLKQENKQLDAYIRKQDSIINSFKQDTLILTIYEKPTNTIADTNLVDRILADRIAIINTIANRLKQ